jgi:predicted transcriptional regulator
MPSKKKFLKPVTGAVPDPIRKRLVVIALQDRRSLSQVVRIALEEFVGRRKDAEAELVERAS